MPDWLAKTLLKLGGAYSKESVNLRLSAQLYLSCVKQAQLPQFEVCIRFTFEQQHQMASLYF